MLEGILLFIGLSLFFGTISYFYEKWDKKGRPYLGDDE